MEKLIEALKKEMKQKGINQSELAKKTNLSNSFVSMILNKKRVPHLGSLCAICKSLNIKMSDLFLTAESLK